MSPPGGLAPRASVSSALPSFTNTATASRQHNTAVAPSTVSPASNASETAANAKAPAITSALRMTVPLQRSVHRRAAATIGPAEVTTEAARYAPATPAPPSHQPSGATSSRPATQPITDAVTGIRASRTVPLANALIGPIATTDA